VQNFNENISILVMNGLYASMVRGGMQIEGVTIAFGMIVTFAMLYLWRKHSHDQD
jgi:LPLT family lysophospholipid transporter-like MFS transporter